MTYPGYGTFAIGNTVYPLSPAITNTLLQDSDPTLYWMLQYFASELNTYIGARWTAEMTRAGLDLPSPVGMQFPQNPFPYLQDVGAKFPMLAIYWVDGAFLEKTISYEREESNLEIAWVLPPLTLSQLEIAGPFLKNVKDILQDRSEEGADPNFMNNFDWGQAAGFDWLQMKSFSRVTIPHTSTHLPFEGLVMQCKIRMRNQPVSGQFAPLDQVNTELDILPGDGYVIPDTIFPNIVDIQNILDE
jgi:hypothetical protein